MKTYISILAFTVGCSGAVAARLPNGAAGGVVTCSNKSECFKYATDICPDTYQVLEADDKPATDFSSRNGRTEYVIQCSNDETPRHTEGVHRDAGTVDATLR